LLVLGVNLITYQKYLCFLWYCKVIKGNPLLQVGACASDTYEGVTIAVYKLVTDPYFLKKMSECP